MLSPSHLTESRLDAPHRTRLYRRVLAARARRRRVRRAAVGLGALAVVALAVLGATRGFTPTEATVALRSAQRDTSTVVLADGSEVLPAAGSRVALRQNRPDDVQVVLSEGSVDFSVSRRPERRFIVLLPSVSLSVVGTRFTVTVGPAEQTLRVHEGAVEVRADRSDELLGRIEAGGSWSARIERPEAQKPPASDQAVPEHAPSAVGGKPSSPANPESKAGEAAARLFDEASRARRRGLFAEAIAGYEKLLARYPDDRHAALAAFELGRLKRQRRDPEGAARALEQALDAPEATPLGEDALAQLVLSYDEAGNVPRCKAAQQRYLAAYPRGVHAAEVGRRCRGDGER